MVPSVIFYLWACTILSYTIMANPCSNAITVDSTSFDQRAMPFAVDSLPPSKTTSDQEQLEFLENHRELIKRPSWATIGKRPSWARVG